MHSPNDLFPNIWSSASCFWDKVDTLSTYSANDFLLAVSIVLSTAGIAIIIIIAKITITASNSTKVNPLKIFFKLFFLFFFLQLFFINSLTLQFHIIIWISKIKHYKVFYSALFTLFLFINIFFFLIQIHMD